MNIRIEFDGGTPCNVPSRGYGDGYGSYRIDQERPVRLNFYQPMSSNAAEILTLVKAIQEAKQKGAQTLLIIGDSKIALNWADRCCSNIKGKISKKSSPVFRNAISELRRTMEGIVSVETRWQPRLKSVATLGH